MEILFAILLLIGGFTLGSVTAEKEEAVTQTSDTSKKNEIKFSHEQAIGNQYQNSLAQCHSNGTVIYKDLTIPYQMNPPERNITDCVNCPDE